MPKVLVVEDHTEIREIIRMRTAARWIFAAITAANGKRAIEAAIREKPT
jgi:DNA-binding response OmpR family regulator